MKDPLWSLMGMLYQSHPWHGVPIGKKAPGQVPANIEMPVYNELISGGMTC